ncbi:MAG: asparaginase [Thiolinea sp.]
MNPVLAEVWRGQEIESKHRGAAIVIDAEGNTLLDIGDTRSNIFPRSAIKPIQALPLVESGAADAFGFSAEHIALACASHNGEELHVNLVTDVLQKISLNFDDLICGEEYPMQQQAAHDLVRQQQKPGRQHHNCSGKHSSMLTLCRHMNWPTANYHHFDHPSQQTWRKALSELCDVDADKLPWDFDGCGIPALALPLKNIALGFSRYATSEQQPAKRAQAMQRIIRAIAAYPMNIAGTGRACTNVVAASNGRVIVKTGAEGVFTGMIPERGIGFALKIDDGARRAAETALGGLLAKLDEPVANSEVTQPFFRRELKNSRGKVVGKVIPAAF